MFQQMLNLKQQEMTAVYQALDSHKITAMKLLIESVKSFSELEILSKAALPELVYNRVVASIHDLGVQILNCEKNGYKRDEILEVLSAARKIHSRSPFIKRLQDWPQGYPGDYNTIEYLCNSRNKAPENSVEYFCEEYALRSAVAQQHRNKVHYQSSLILSTFIKSSEKPRVLSIGCGSCRDLQLIQEYLNKFQGELFLNDMDSEALALSRAKLKKIERMLQIFPGNAIKIINKLGAVEKFDLVIAGGLFDYLSNKHIGYLVDKILGSLLKTGGKLFFTNIAKGNPYRPWMEYLADWVLIERAESDILAICRDIGLDTETISIKRDETGLTLLVEITKTL